jgi:hypothetical protein
MTPQLLDALRLEGLPLGPAAPAIVPGATPADPALPAGALMPIDVVVSSSVPRNRSGAAAGV